MTNDENDNKILSRGTGQRGGAITSDQVLLSDYRPLESDAPGNLSEECAKRLLTFWADGFQVGDAELMRYDDPANMQFLSEINAGRAPPSLFNVEPGQPLEIKVAKRTGEYYTGH